MNKTRIIEEELAKIDADLQELYARQKDLNNELRNIEKEKIKLEIEKWDITPGSTFVLFTKDNDYNYSTCFGYEIEELTDSNCVEVIETSLTLIQDGSHMSVRKATIDCRCLRTWREQAYVYKVANEHYRRLQYRWIRLDQSAADIATLKTKVSESALLQVD